MAYPVAYSDIAKAANDLLNKDFYHTASLALEFKTKAPNGVTFNAKTKSSQEGSTSGNIEAKFNDPPTGVAFTQGWSTANSLDTKVELDNTITKGVKAEIATTYLPASGNYSAKTNFFFKQSNIHGRAFIDYFKGPTATVDAVFGHEGFLVGAEATYDVQKAAISRYSAAVGYSAKEYAAAVTATNNLKVFAASYYHKANVATEVGAKATWDSQAPNSKIGFELAAKYRIDGTSFAKGKLNDRGIAALAYNVKVREGVTLGFGGSFDTQKMNESSHKVGMSLTFEN